MGEYKKSRNMKTALINTNKIQPPIAPIGLEYIAESLSAASHGVNVLDLCWQDDNKKAITGFLDQSEYGLIGITLRNTDDCVFTNRQSFIADFIKITDLVRGRTSAPIIIGGAGFSIMPRQIMSACRADAGVWGEGEFVFADIAARIESGQRWDDLPNLIVPADGTFRRNPAQHRSLDELPPIARNWFDNRRYFNEGGQAGIETKRGCPCRCIYCADPVAKGKQVRLRPPPAVADELQCLLEQGIDHIHTCDSEFNIPEHHAIELCQEIVRRDLGPKLRWYAYCSPVPFSPGLARLMHQAGCVGINFGVDSGDDNMLKRLKRGYTSSDVLNTAKLCKENNIAVMYDLLLGAPGESNASLTNTLELMKQAEVDRVGVNFGVRIYPGTELASSIEKPEIKQGLTPSTGPLDPVFFLEPNITDTYSRLVEDLIGDDPRFLFFDRSKPSRNYNYNANQTLIDAIGNGHRGAYWHILAKI